MAVDKKSREELAAEQARKEAELFVKGKSKEEIEKELKRMDKGPGFLGWVRDRINGFLNFVKIAALSVFLGRRETSRRMDAGTLEAEQKARENAAAKLARQEVLKEKLKELDPSRETEKQDEVSKDKEQNPNEQNKSDAEKNGQDQETGKEEEHSEIDNRVLRKGRIPNKKQSKIRKKTRMPKTARNRIILAKNIRKLLTNRIKNSQKRKTTKK